jgi:hypothetical protein
MAGFDIELKRISLMVIFCEHGKHVLNIALCICVNLYQGYKTHPIFYSDSYWI